MNKPLYAIPGREPATPAAEPPAAAADSPAPRLRRARSPQVLRESQVEAVLDELDRELVGLAPVKQRIRDIAALLVIDKLRAEPRPAGRTRRRCT